MLEEMAAILEGGQMVTFSPKGSSMLPFIREGRDMVTLRLMPCVGVGDIVLARLPDRYVLHRVFDVNMNRLTLMGDGNLYQTEICTQGDVIGTVIWIIRDGKRQMHPGKAYLWRVLLPVRRILLGVYRRLPTNLQ